MTVRVAINGFGRIGRTLCRAIWARPDLDIEVVAVNDLQAVEHLAYLLEHDSISGRLDGGVRVAGSTLRAAGKRLPVLNAESPEDLPWADLGVSVVVESSRMYAKASEAARHLAAGAERVVVSQPSEGADATIVVGINDTAYDPTRHRVVSMASCTTNCVAPMAKVLDDAFGITAGLMTTVHAYTSDQALVDGARGSLRDARAAAINIIPTTTGAARAIGHVLPTLSGRLDGSSLRVPVPDGSIAELTVNLAVRVTATEVNAAFEDEAHGMLAGIVEYSEAPIVSADIVGNPASCVFDAPLTTVQGGLVKVVGWYDNEWGYSNRLAELLAIVQPSPVVAAC